jgi:hypothetical protein
MHLGIAEDWLRRVVVDRDGMGSGAPSGPADAASLD